MSITEDENQVAISQAGNEAGIPRQPDDNDISAGLAAADVPIETAAADDEAAAAAANDEIEIQPGGNDTALDNPAASSLPAEDGQVDEFVGLNEDDLKDPALGPAFAESDEEIADISAGKSIPDHSENAAAPSSDENTVSRDKNPPKQTVRKTAKGSQASKRGAGGSLAIKIVSVALVAVIENSIFPILM